MTIDKGMLEGGGCKADGIDKRNVGESERVERRVDKKKRVRRVIYKGRLERGGGEREKV